MRTTIKQYFPSCFKLYSKCALETVWKQVFLLFWFLPWHTSSFVFHTGKTSSAHLPCPKTSAASRLEDGHVLVRAGGSSEFHQSSTLRIRLLQWSGSMYLQSPRQTMAILSSHLSHFLLLSQLSSSLLPSLTVQVRGEKLYLLLSKQENWERADTKEIQEFKVTGI